MPARTPGRRAAGFTLIELLVVVAIIALLVSLLLPALGRSRAQTRSAVCQSNLYQLAVAMQEYVTEWNGRVPFVRSPMTNGSTLAKVPGYGQAAATDEQLNPFDRGLWPESLPSLLIPTYLGSEERVFACPAAILGWPRKASPLRYTYREAAANQPNGTVPKPTDVYKIEHFAFLDGRMFTRYKLVKTGNVLADAQMEATMRGTYVRDLVRWDAGRVVGPHNGGVNVLNRNMEVEQRRQEVVQEDLAPNAASVKF